MTTAKNVTPAKTYQALDRILLANAPSLLKKWTGRDVEIKETECIFINTARDDGSLGSCSVNLTTGAFNDHADPTFHGFGLIRIHAQLKGVDEQASYERLQYMHTSHPKVAADLRQAQASQSKTKKVATATEPAPIREAGAVEPMDMHPQLGLVSKSWEYKTADGKSVAFVVCRFDLEDGKKDTRPQAWSKEQQTWVWQFPTGTLPVYNLDAITSRVDATILVNEGEKATEAAQRQFPDMVATTTAKGANNAHSADWSVLADREVIICPDADEAGTGYALAVIGQAVVHGATGIRVKDTLKIGWELGVGADSILTTWRCGGKVGLLGGSSCTHTKTEFEQLSFISSSINASRRPLLSWDIPQRMHSRLGVENMSSDKTCQWVMHDLG
jgi:hypothetical protein